MRGVGMFLILPNMHQIHFKILTILLAQCLKDDAGKQGNQGGQHDETAYNQCWKVWNQSCFCVGDQDWNQETGRNQSENKSDKTKKAHGLVCAV